METYIKGNYKRSIYTSDNGFVIGIFKIKETNEENLKEFINKTITFTGQFVELNVDDTYFFYGEMVDHQKYGLQFKVNEYERVKPSDKDGIIEFLSSDLFNGIGEKIATQIVETLGENALDKILEEKSNLYLVPKLSSKKIDIIYNTLTKYEESHKTIVYLTELGFNMKDSLNVYNFYKSNTIIQIESNIFKIIDDIEEISFTKIDEISKKLNYKENDINRIKSCILYVMKSLTYKNGDTYLNLNEIYINAINYLKIELNKEEFNTYLDELSIEQKTHIENDKYYLNNIYEAENKVSNKLNTLLNIPLTKYKKLDTYIELLEKENNIKYDEIQLTAIKKALENNLLIITGGPGTGKTTIIKSIVQLYKLLNKLNDEELINEISLLAPTGRASKRLSEATLFPATTIHRFLGWNKELNSFKIDEYNKDKSKLIIIDEVSMIDISLIDNLLKGLNDNIKLILVGDFNQLPSVGPGQVLKDLINSDIIDVVKLKLLYRQNENSYIPVLAKEINDNNLSSDFYETRDDYTFLECTNYSLKNTIIALAETIEKKGYEIIIKDCSLGKGLPVYGAIIIDKQNHLYNFKLGSDFVPYIAVDRCLNEAYQSTKGFIGLPIDFSWTNNQKNTLNEEVVNSNYHRILESSSGIWPLSIFSPIPSYEYTGENPTWGISNDSDLQYCFNIVEQLGFNIYIRNNSITDFPTYYIIIPGMNQVLFSRKAYK